uniref:Uncharacterized protein n=1 Tax=Opuntia streptacantha TaxID=393608 RepID=A0A7C9A0I7_OPUST
MILQHLLVSHQAKGNQHLLFTKDRCLSLISLLLAMMIPENRLLLLWLLSLLLLLLRLRCSAMSLLPWSRGALLTVQRENPPITNNLKRDKRLRATLPMPLPRLHLHRCLRHLKVSNHCHHCRLSLTLALSNRILIPSQPTSSRDLVSSHLRHLRLLHLCPLCHLCHRMQWPLNSSRLLGQCLMCLTAMAQPSSYHHLLYPAILLWGPLSQVMWFLQLILTQIFRDPRADSIVHHHLCQCHPFLISKLCSSCHRFGGKGAGV